MTEHSKALRLVEELEGLACNGPDNCESGRVMRAAASLIRAQQEEVRELTASLNEALAEVGKGPLACAQCGLREAAGVHEDASACNSCSAPHLHHSFARAALTEEK
jgi:recombinational DNA repair protein RecR